MSRGATRSAPTYHYRPKAWADYLGNQHLTVALLDKLLYRATAITIEGPSYRLAQHTKRQQQRKGKDKSAK